MDNLFWSCSTEDHCGKLKDKLVATYAPGDLLKPDVDDGRRFLRFFDDGSVEPRDGLGPSDLARAKETIRVFGLGSRRLQACRVAYLDAPKHQVAEAFEVLDDSDELRAYIDSLAGDYAGSAFVSAIVDVLGAT